LAETSWASNTLSGSGRVKLKLTQTSNGQKGKSPMIRGTPIAEYETR